jgi:hypothetical protein
MSAVAGRCCKLFCNYAVITTRAVGAAILENAGRREKEPERAVAVFFRDHCTCVCLIMSCDSSLLVDGRMVWLGWMEAGERTRVCGGSAGNTV